MDEERDDHEEIALGLSNEMMKAMHAADHKRFHSAMSAYLDHMENKPEEETEE